jgi:hypothetical protein
MEWWMLAVAVLSAGASMLVGRTAPTRADRIAARALGVVAAVALAAAFLIHFDVADADGIVDCASYCTGYQAAVRAAVWGSISVAAIVVPAALLRVLWLRGRSHFERTN